MRARDEEGFTLIEILVVVIIIGILAAIAIPTFLNQRTTAQDASAKANARNLYTHFAVCAAESSSNLDGCRDRFDGDASVEDEKTGLPHGGGSGQVRVVKLESGIPAAYQGYASDATSATGSHFYIVRFNAAPAEQARICYPKKTTGGCTGTPSDAALAGYGYGSW